MNEILLSCHCTRRSGRSASGFAVDGQPKRPACNVEHYQTPNGARRSPVSCKHLILIEAPSCAYFTRSRVDA
jgi:hypothetical protein